MNRKLSSKRLNPQSYFFVEVSSYFCPQEVVFGFQIALQKLLERLIPWFWILPYQLWIISKVSKTRTGGYGKYYLWSFKRSKCFILCKMFLRQFQCIKTLRSHNLFLSQRLWTSRILVHNLECKLEGENFEEIHDSVQNSRLGPVVWVWSPHGWIVCIFSFCFNRWTDGNFSLNSFFARAVSRACRKFG